MRVVLVCALLAACATGPAPSPAQRLAGCWINRDARAVTMRWNEDAARPGTLIGTKTSFGIAGVNASERYALEPQGAGWRLCQRQNAGEEVRCWDVAQGEGGSLEGGRVFIDGGGDSVRIAVIGEGPERVIFQGRREGCR